MSSATNDQKKDTMEMEQENYLKEQMKSRKVPAKLSGFPLVSFIEKDGKLYPVYRSEE